MSLLSFTKRIAGRGAKKPAKKSKATTVATQSEAASAAVPQNVTTTGMLGLYPLITEKSVNQQGQANIVAFRAVASATKGQIMTAIKERYNVTPLKVRTLQMMPKVRRRGVSVGKTAAWKKVYVSLPAGKTIDLSV